MWAVYLNVFLFDSKLVKRLNGDVSVILNDFCPSDVFGLYQSVNTVQEFDFTSDLHKHGRLISVFISENAAVCTAM